MQENGTLHYLLGNHLGSMSIPFCSPTLASDASDSGSELDHLGACKLEMSADGGTWQSLSTTCEGMTVRDDVVAGQPYTFRLTATAPFRSAPGMLRKQNG